MESSFYFAVAFFILSSISFSLRLLYILPAFHRSSPPPRKRGTPTHLLIVLGSGGHTAEMLSLLSDLNPNKYTHRTYVISSGDGFSASKAVNFERMLEARTSPSTLRATAKITNQERSRSQTPSYSIHFVPRARRIHQSLLTTPVSSVRCLKACLSLLRSPTPPIYPDLILINGPGTSVIVLIASLLLRFFAVSGSQGKMRSIYIESWARVKRLSLSGRILVAVGAVDRVLVQWEELSERGFGEYMGCLVGNVTS